MYKVKQTIGDDYIVNSQHLLTLRYIPHCRIFWSENFTTYFNGMKQTNGSWSIQYFDSETFEERFIYSHVNSLYSQTESFQYISKIKKNINNNDIFDIPIKIYMNLPEKVRNNFVGVNFDNKIKWNYVRVDEPYEIGLNIQDKIPREYIINSSIVRIRFLVGIIVNKGYIEDDYIKIHCEGELMTDISFLCNSLGYRIKKDKNSIFLFGSIENISKLPILLPDGLNIDNKDKNLISIESLGEGEFCGFEVDENKRFLLGDFTVTHNCEQTGRTVIGPDPTLKMGQLGVPEKIAKNLTIPERVAEFNYDKLTKIVNEGKANYILKNNGKSRINLKYAMFRRGTELIYGDEIHRNTGGNVNILNIKTGKELLMDGDRIKRGDDFLEEVKYPEKKKIKLIIGDIVERQLVNKDIVLLNRQPTLHQASMMAQEIVIMKHNTFRFNLAICRPFNADFNKINI